MKLLLENWRQYLNESENSPHYGDLYLFENDTVTKTSFYDALNTLSESDDDVNTFLENWEKSVDYQLGLLREEYDPGEMSDYVKKKLTPQEAAVYRDLRENPPAKADMTPTQQQVLNKVDKLMFAESPIWTLLYQSWALEKKFKEKAVNKVISVSKKINDYAEKNPKTVKVAKVAVGGLLAAAAVYGIYKVIDKGGDASDVMELAQSLQPEDPDLAREVAECAQEFSPEKVVEFAQEQQDVVEKVADSLSTVDQPAIKQAAEIADSVAQDMPEPLDWNEMFMDAAKEKQQVMQGDASPITSAAQTAAEKGVEVLSQSDIQDFATLKKKMILGDFDEMSRKEFKRVIDSLLDNNTITFDDARDIHRTMRQKNPTAFGKVLQKIKLTKTYQEPDGLDYWNALFDLEIKK
jgi:hypothetical protein